MLLLTALALLCAGVAQAAPPTVWAAPSLKRVRPDEAAQSVPSITLYAAKGESESFQIIVKAPSGGLTNVTVQAPSLGGAKLTLYREHYIYLSSGTGDWATNRNKPEGPGYYPDALIPFVTPSTGTDLVGATYDAVPFSLAAGKNQPIWVDIDVPRTMPAGQYSGVFTVTSNQGSASVTVNLKVWNFALPLKPALESCFMYWPTDTGGMGRELYHPDAELLRNRINPSRAGTAYEREFIDTLGLQTCNLGFWSNATNSGTINPAPSVSSIETAKARHQQDLHFYAYTADEISSASLYSGLKSWARALHAADVDNLITMAPVPELYDDGSGTGRSVVDIWVLLPKLYDRSKSYVLDVQRKGDDTWSYNCLNQDDYSPKWLLDYAPINYRIQPGFINQSLALNGLLYWRVDYWTSDPWNNVKRFNGGYPGEGMLVYPGTQAGLSGQVVPAMRLKYVRDGVDDYDYIELLKQQGQADWALSLARTIGPDWSNWTRDTAALEAARVQMGDKLDSLNGGGGGTTISFQDVPPNYWAAPQILACAAAGIVNGYDDGTYRPKLEVTREQMAAYLARAQAGGDDRVPAGPAEASFPDVSPESWAYRYVEYMQDTSVVGGYSDGTYRPEERVDRGQMAAFVSRAIASPTGEAGLSGYAPPATGTFTDVTAESWAYTYVEYLAAQGVVGGYDDNTYRPGEAVTRDQMAVYVTRAWHLPMP